MEALFFIEAEGALRRAWALLPLLAAAVVVAAAWRARSRVRPGTLVWAGVFAALALLLCGWTLARLSTSVAPTFALCQAVLAACGVAVLQRERLATWLAGRHPALTGARDAAALVVAAVLGLLSIEVAYNSNWCGLDLDAAAATVGLLLLAMGALYFLGQRRGGPAAAVALLCGIWGLVQNFLDRFKSTALLPSDLTALQTAAAVSGGYTYDFTTFIYWTIAFTALALAALAFIVPVRRQDARPGGMRRAVANVAAGAALAAALAAAVTLPDYHEALGVKVDYWNPAITCHDKGEVVTFVTAAQDLAIEVPEGYSDEAAEELVERYAARFDADPGAYAQASAQFDEARPNVVAVMNETYADLSVFEELHSGYTGTYVTQEVWRQSLLGGFTNVSVYGGGTCNTEYEFLAESPLAFVGAGTYPFQQYDLGAVESLPAHFAQLGYGTAAMHPNNSYNWNREVVYEAMGFDQTFFIEDFEGAPQFHSHATDGATYDKVLDVLRGSDQPQFVFDVTMQNHSGYDHGDIPADALTGYVSDVDETPTAELNEYLSCIQKSDEDLKAFLEELAAFDEPVVVVFFGDHHPWLSWPFNDAYFGSERTFDHEARIRQTPFFIWANYDVAGSVRGTTVQTCPSLMGAQLLAAIGAPLSDYQKAQLVLARTVPVVSTVGFQDAEGAWHDADDRASAAWQAYLDYRVIHYREIASRF